MTRPPALRALLKELSKLSEHDPSAESVRLAVRLRARDACEYCLLPTTGLFHIDHIVPAALWRDPHPERHGVAPSAPISPHRLENYAWCCPFCNLAKGQRITHRLGHRAIRLFNPRRDRWPDHFVFVHNFLFIVGVSNIGRATEQALAFNGARPGGPLGTRHDAVLLGWYPPVWAHRFRLVDDSVV